MTGWKTDSKLTKVQNEYDRTKSKKAKLSNKNETRGL